MKWMLILGTCLGSLSLAACQHGANTHTQTITQQPTPYVVAEVTQLATAPETERNTARLIQEHGFCLIEFVGYFPKAKVTEHWAIAKQHPVSATITVEHFADDALTQPTSSFSEPLDHQDAERLANLKKLKSYFKAGDLKRCETAS